MYICGMPEQFMLPLMYKSESREYPTTLIRLPYTYQLQVEVDDQKLFFEPDDSGEFRLVKMLWQNEEDIKKIDSGLINRIIETLNSLYN